RRTTLLYAIWVADEGIRTCGLSATPKGSQAKRHRAEDATTSRRSLCQIEKFVPRSRSISMFSRSKDRSYRGDRRLLQIGRSFLPNGLQTFARTRLAIAFAPMRQAPPGIRLYS